MESHSPALGVTGTCRLASLNPVACNSISHLPFQAVLVGEDEILMSSGNGLFVYSLNSSDDWSPLSSCRKSKEFVWSETGRGFSCLAYNFSTQLVAFSPRRADPEICIQRLDGKHPLIKLSHGAAIEYKFIAFSTDGKLVAAVGSGATDFGLWVWAINSETVDKDISPHVFLSLSRPFRECLFKPRDPNQIALLETEGNAILVIRVSHLQADQQIAIRELTRQDEQHAYTSIAWNQHNQLLAGTSSGTVIIFNAIDCTLLEVIAPAGNQDPGISVKNTSKSVSYILVANDSTAVGFSDGTIHFWEREGDSDSPLASIKQVSNVGSEILYLSCTPDSKRIVCIGVDGGIGYYNSSDGMTSSRHPSCIRLHTCITPHVAAIRLTCKPIMSVLASGGADGKLRLWLDFCEEHQTDDFRTSARILDIGSPITAMVSIKDSPLLVVGTADGYIYFVHVGRKSPSPNEGISAIILKRIRISSEKVVLLKYQPSTKKLAMNCFGERKVLVACLEPNNMKVIGYIHATELATINSLEWSSTKDFHLFVGHGNGNVSCYNAIEMTFETNDSRQMECLWTKNLLENKLLREMISVGDGGLYVIDGQRQGLYYIPPCKSESDENEILPCGCGDAASCITYHGDLSAIISGTISGEVIIYDVGEGGKLRVLSSGSYHACSVASLCFSPKGPSLYSIGIDGTLFVHNLMGLSKRSPLPIEPSSLQYDHLVRAEQESEFIDEVHVDESSDVCSERSGGKRFKDFGEKSREDKTSFDDSHEHNHVQFLRQCEKATERKDVVLHKYNKSAFVFTPVGNQSDDSENSSCNDGGSKRLEDDSSDLALFPIDVRTKANRVIQSHFLLVSAKELGSSLSARVANYFELYRLQLTRSEIIREAKTIGNHEMHQKIEKLAEQMKIASEMTKAQSDRLKHHSSILKDKVKSQKEMDDCFVQNMKRSSKKVLSKDAICMLEEKFRENSFFEGNPMTIPGRGRKTSISIPDSTQAAFDSLLNKRAKNEDEIKLARANVEEIKSIYHDSKKLKRQTESSLSELEEDVKKEVRAEGEARANADIIINVEVGGKRNLFAEYKDYVVLSPPVIRGLEESIVKLTKQREKSSSRVATLKQETHQLNWEKRLVELQINELVEDYKDFRALRVTAHLKKLIDGSKESEEISAQNFLSKQTAMQRMQEAQLKIIQNKSEIFASNIKNKEVENVLLKKQIMELKERIAKDEKKKAEITKGFDKAENQRLKMRYIMKRSKIVHDLHSQEKEIEVLRGQLKKLRAGTFPQIDLEAMRE